MRLLGYVCAAALLSGGAARAQAVDADAELKKLDGKWLVAHRTYTPSKANEAVAKILTNLGQKVEIKDGKLSALDPDKTGYHLTVEFDPTVKPRSVDLKMPGDKKRALLGIYRLEDDILAILVGPGDERPTTFENKEEPVLLLLKRIPK